MPMRQLSRRRMLALAGLSAGLPVLAACGGATTPSPAPKPAEPKPPTAAAAPTNTPAAAAKPTEAPKPAAAEPTKPAAAATTAPTAAAAAKPAAGAKKIVFLIYGGQAEQAAWNARADAFAKKYPGQT